MSFRTQADSVLFGFRGQRTKGPYLDQNHKSGNTLVPFPSRLWVDQTKTRRIGISISIAIAITGAEVAPGRLLASPFVRMDVIVHHTSTSRRRPVDLTQPHHHHHRTNNCSQYFSLDHSSPTIFPVYS